MKVRDEKLGAFIQAMNNDEAHTYLIKELADIRKQHSSDREEDRWVEVRNGDSKKILLKTAVADTHDRVVNIEENTNILIE